MTENTAGTPASEGHVPGAEALHAIATGGDQQAAMTTLAQSEVLLPVADEGGESDPQVVQLPVYEQQDGTRLVPVFTSEATLAAAMPDVRQYRNVPMSALGGGWPSDDLCLAVDPGSPDALNLTADNVKALPALAGA
ncbi:SseB family protein [Streptacidiphilus sp. ASG 303]|uniref:SseB family protein n=1 Tax=Streptacidiphilus sp. ASG 303 TaxID=2896847 RepID=UPI001E3CB675|nr:SseB family protein [Streptacidiphilus sp. ASG 303]MCD0480981.1 SseB family protein [Streptacidiphilus sp. ASG 303]